MQFDLFKNQNKGRGGRGRTRTKHKILRVIKIIHRVTNVPNKLCNEVKMYVSLCLFQVCQGCIVSELIPKNEVPPSPSSYEPYHHAS